MTSTLIPLERLGSAVLKGAALLDFYTPGWAEGLQNAELRMNEGCACICARVFGQYDRALEAFDVIKTGREESYAFTSDESAEHGFMYFQDLTKVMSAANQFDVLKWLWYAQIAQRVAA